MSSELGTHSPRLGEGSVYERLRRSPAVRFDPHLAHGTLIYDTAARDVLAGVHREYLDIGQRFGLPMVAATPTWRASRGRAEAAGLDVHTVNLDNAQFMRELIAGYGPTRVDIQLFGQMGPSGDAYWPEEALETSPAADFHRPQAEELDGLAELDTEAPTPFAAAVSALKSDFGIAILGGCCGTTTAHIEAIAERISPRTS